MPSLNSRKQIGNSPLQCLQKARGPGAQGRAGCGALHSAQATSLSWDLKINAQLEMLQQPESKYRGLQAVGPLPRRPQKIFDLLFFSLFLAQARKSDSRTNPDQGFVSANIPESTPEVSQAIKAEE